MPEDQLPVEDGAVTANETQAQPDTDWQKRYTDTHANWNELNERMSRFKSDPNAVIEFIRETHPDLLDDSDDEPEDVEDFEPDEDDRPLTRAEFKAWEADRDQRTAQQSAQQQFESDLKTFVNGRELDQWGERAIRFALNNGEIKGPDDLKKQVDEYFERQAPAKKPRVPHVPTTGEAATDVPNWDAMTPGEVNQYMAERVRANQAQ